MLGYISVEVQLNKLSELTELVMGYILLLRLILNSGAHSTTMHYFPMHCDKLHSITRPAHCWYVTVVGIACERVNSYMYLFGCVTLQRGLYILV